MMTKNIDLDDKVAPQYSLAHLTLLGCSTPELIYIASRTGYDAVSPRLIPMGVSGECPCPPLDKELIRAARNALQVTGMKVHDIELVRIDEYCDVKSYEAAIEVGAELGATKLMASAWTLNRNNDNYLIDTYSEICDLAASYGISVALEFPTFSRLRNLREAAHILTDADRPNSELLVDTLYMHMSRVKPSELEALPPSWFTFIQVSDVLPGVPDDKDGMIQIARDSRLYPGDGCIDFEAIIERLPPVNYSIELPNKSRVEELGYEEHARRCLRSAKKTFDHIRSKRATGLNSPFPDKLHQDTFYDS